ncbi:MAG: CvpA family protein [Myxococcota bacterium]|nr:CvpA family protein [Myxococcota bacterium]
MGGIDLAPVDWVTAGVLALALLRGLLRGLLREAFSVASLGAACVLTKLYYGPLADVLIDLSGGRVNETAAPWVAGFLVVVGSIGAVTLLGRVLRRGAKAAGLGWADRAGGAVIGTAEGVLIAGVLVAMAGAVVGRDHPVLADSRSLDYLEQLELMAESRQDEETPDVAAGPGAGP